MNELEVIEKPTGGYKINIQTHFITSYILARAKTLLQRHTYTMDCTLEAVPPSLSCTVVKR